MTTTVYTIGHSIHPLEGLVAVLHSQGVDCLIDVRTVPVSRRNSQFGQKELSESMPEFDIDVGDIMNGTSTKLHTLTSFARVDGTRV